MEFRLLQKEWKFYFVPLEIVYVYVNECTYVCVYNLNTYITLIFCGIPPKYGPSNR